MGLGNIMKIKIDKYRFSDIWKVIRYVKIYIQKNLKNESIGECIIKFTYWIRIIEMSFINKNCLGYATLNMPVICPNCDRPKQRTHQPMLTVASFYICGDCHHEVCHNIKTKGFSLDGYYYDIDCSIFLTKNL